MTEPKRPYPNGVPIAPDTVMPPRRSVRWGATADSPPTEIHDDPGLTRAYLAGLAAGRTEAAADFDRLRDERDSWRRTAERLETEKVEARRVAGVLADALRNNAPCYCDHPLRAGLPPCSRCSALAVFDTLTEEKTDAP